MVRSRRSFSKEDASSVLADSGISLSSPSGALLLPEEEDELIGKLCVSEDEDDGEEEDEEDDDEDDDEEEDEKEEEKHASVDPKKMEDTDTDAETDAEAKDVSISDSCNTTVSRHTPTTKRQRVSSSTSSPTKARKPKSKTATQKTRKSYECHVCHKHFGGNTDLRRHLLIHTDERPFQCTVCDKRYRQLVNLKNHTKSAHETQRHFRCKLCPKSFALKERLRLHMRVHSGEKPYSCTLCEKKFARGGQLQQHLVTHDGGTGVRTIHCDQCWAAFSSAANLRFHMQRHEEGPNHLCHICNELFLSEAMLRAHVNMQHFKLKEFDCEVCKETIKDDDLGTHMKKHSNVKSHVCEVCHSVFTQKSQYNVHIRMHTGERPYQCRICWQSFAHSSVLKLHIRKHTGEKPFKCLLCKSEVAFSQLAHLKTHMKKIHKQENPYMCEGCQKFFKVKIDLQVHLEQSPQCVSISNDRLQSDSSDLAQLSHLRFLIALLLRKISSEQKLNQLGYEKRLIDNVVIASLKLANRKTYDDNKMSEIDRMRLNVQEFLEWIVPAQVMENFKREQLSVEKILDKIVTLYMKQK